MVIQKIKTALIFILALIIVLSVLSNQIVMSPKSISIEKISINKDYIVISGFTHGGLFNYRRCDVEYMDGILYIKYKGGVKLPWTNGTNSPDFYPILNKYENIDKIYISSALKKDSRLIWSKEIGRIIDNANDY